MTTTVEKPFEHIPKALVSRSKDVQDAYAIVKKLAIQRQRVLFHGPSGAGKEYLARHYAAEFGLSLDLPSTPFRSVNCGCFGKLASSELFGTVKGAFTDALDKPGLFQECENGVLFLDEVGDLNEVAQGMLLTALSPGTGRRVGATKTFSTKDVTVISATEQPLENLRDSLVERLGHKIRVPSLADRQEDIGPAVEQFVVDAILSRRDLHTTKWFLSEDVGRAKQFAAFLARKAMPFLQPPAESYRWPGNFRELRRAVDFSVCVADFTSETEFLQEMARLFAAKCGGDSAAELSAKVGFDEELLTRQVEVEADTEPATSETETGPDAELLAREATAVPEPTAPAAEVKPELDEKLHAKVVELFEHMEKELDETQKLAHFIASRGNRRFFLRDVEAVMPNTKKRTVGTRLNALKSAKIITMITSKQGYKVREQGMHSGAEKKPFLYLHAVDAGVALSELEQTKVEFLENLLQTGKGLYLSGDRGGQRAAISRALAERLQERHSGFYWSFGAGTLAELLRAIDRRLLEAHLIDEVTVAARRNEPIETQIALLAGYVGTLLGNGRQRPALVFDDLDVVELPSERDAINSIARYWANCVPILVGEKMPVSSNPNPATRLLECKLEEL